jgi:regulator of replication initiation timing
MANGPDTGVRYLFIVARKNPDILARVKERLHGDPRIEVVADRRYGERRRASAPHVTERRAGDRRRPTNVWNDLTIYPTLVAQRHVDSYAELERKLSNALRESQAMAVENDQLREMTAELERRLQALETDDQQVRAENARLREELTELHRRLGALTAAEAEFKAEVTALLGQAEQALGSLITKSQRLASGGPPQREPRLRSV